jgi:hypothetical protein
MQHIQGISRNQLQMVSLEDKITPDNALRFIDAFVSVIDLKNLVFASSILKKPSGNGFILSRFLLDFCCFWFLDGVVQRLPLLCDRFYFFVIS